MPLGKRLPPEWGDFYAGLDAMVLFSVEPRVYPVVCLVSEGPKKASKTARTGGISRQNTQDMLDREDETSHGRERGSVLWFGSHSAAAKPGGTVLC